MLPLSIALCTRKAYTSAHWEQMFPDGLPSANMWDNMNPGADGAPPLPSPLTQPNPPHTESSAPTGSPTPATSGSAAVTITLVNAPRASPLPPQHPPLPLALAQLPGHAANRGGEPPSVAEQTAARSPILAAEGGYAQRAGPDQPAEGEQRSWAACPPAQRHHIHCLQETWLDTPEHPSQRQAAAWIHSACTEPALAGLELAPPTCPFASNKQDEGAHYAGVEPSSSCVSYLSCPSTRRHPAHTAMAACCTASSSGAVTDSPLSTPTGQSDTVPSGATGTRFFSHTCPTACVPACCSSVTSTTSQMQRLTVCPL
jgi:hypothetical protein